jgi:hypothetical protein
MDKERAKEFLLDDDDNGKIFISKDLQKLLDMNGNRLIGIFAVLETESGDTLMHMDWAYSGEPIIMGRFLHKEFFLDANSHQEVVYI